MAWKVEYGDVLYKIIAPNEEESHPVHYCCVANMEYEGRVYACYMNGDEAEDETAPVYDITDWPTIVLQPTTSEAVQFEGEDGTEEEVECEKCDGDGFYFQPVGGGTDPGMTPQQAQLTAQQVEQALKAITARINSKKLEVDSLNRMRAVAPALLEKLTFVPGGVPESELLKEASGAVTDYLTAKMNNALMDYEQLSLQKVMFESQQRQVQLATGVLPTNRRPQG